MHDFWKMSIIMINAKQVQQIIKLFSEKMTTIFQYQGYYHISRKIFIIFKKYWQVVLESFGWKLERRRRMKWIGHFIWISLNSIGLNSWIRKDWNIWANYPRIYADWADGLKKIDRLFRNHSDRISKEDTKRNGLKTWFGIASNLVRLNLEKTHGMKKIGRVSSDLYLSAINFTNGLFWFTVVNNSSIIRSPETLLSSRITTSSAAHTTSTSSAKPMTLVPAGKSMRRKSSYMTFHTSNPIRDFWEEPRIISSLKDHLAPSYTTHLFLR